MDGESQAQREARLRSLWGKLDTKKKGTLDYNALKNGLQGMNHREKYAPLFLEGQLLIEYVQLSRMRTV